VDYGGQCIGIFYLEVEWIGTYVPVQEATGVKEEEMNEKGEVKTSWGKGED
jgi:hypothetical protein